MNVIRTRAHRWTRATWQYATLGTTALAIVATWALVELPRAQAATPANADALARLSPACTSEAPAQESRDAGR